MVVYKASSGEDIVNTGHRFHQNAWKVRQHKKTVVWFVSFVWLNKTN